MLCLDLGLGVGIGFVRPLRQNLQSQLTHLRAYAFLGLIGRAVVTGRLIQRVGQLMQPGEHCGAVRQPLFQGTAGRGGRGRFGMFIVHEPLQLYKTLPRSQP